MHDHVRQTTDANVLNMSCRISSALMFLKAATNCSLVMIGRVLYGSELVSDARDSVINLVVRCRHFLPGP